MKQIIKKNGEYGQRVNVTRPYIRRVNVTHPSLFLLFPHNIIHHNLPYILAFLIPTVDGQSIFDLAIKSFAFIPLTNIYYSFLVRCFKLKIFILWKT